MSRGFSLIEVLIAVLVLATGMLALAALQGAITRNSVDAKIRSQGLAVAVDVLDRVRARASASQDDYENLGTGAGAWGAWSGPSMGTAPTTATTYESRTTVTRFVRDSDAGDCGGAGNTPCFRPAAVGDPYRLNNTAEFKRIDVDVRWTDAAGNVRNVAVSDLVTSVTRDLSTAVMNQTPTPPVGIGEPVARIPRPSEAGIIPIAVGDGKETAASNPRPITGRERGRTDETSFQVFTYANEANGVARLTRVIDTRVVGCRCELGALPATLPNNSTISVATNEFFTTPREPTYWNGLDYVEPTEGATGLRGVAVEDANQNQDLCVSCCLDHHDFATQTTKFDPFRNESIHKHYNDPNDNFQFVEATAAGDRYFEVCRFIRVNGVFRVATDARLELMNLLETDATQNASVPLDSKIVPYQNAVKSYVNQLVVGNNANPDMSSFTSVFVDPSTIELSQVGNRRFLHNRGLYVDHLEPEALDAIREAIANCADGVDRIECVLPILPFVSINTTDIAQWDSQAGITNITVTNLGRNVPFPDGGNGNNQQDPPTFARGLTTGVAAGDETATVLMQRSNSGLSDSKPIDWLDAGLAIADPHDPVSGEIYRDSQDFRVGGGGGGGGGCTPPVTGSYNVSIGGVTSLAGIGMSWRDPNPTSEPGCPNPTSTGTCTGTVSGNGNNQTIVNPFACAINYTLPKTSELIIGGFNSSTQGAQVNNPCPGAGNGSKYRPNMCSNLQVASVSIAGSTWVQGGTNGRLSETVTITMPDLPANTAVSVSFTTEAAAVSAGYTCSGSNVTANTCN
jgi:type IV pilus modification protein PilV